MTATVLAVCTHKTCRRHASERVCERLARELERAGAGERLQVVRNGCVGACGSGCSVLVKPHGVTLAGVRPGDVSELVRRGLAGKKPPRRLRVGVRGKRLGQKAARKLARAALR